MGVVEDYLQSCVELALGDTPAARAARLSSVTATTPLVLRDSPVLTITVPAAGAPPGTLRLVTRGSLPIFPNVTAYARIEAPILQSTGAVLPVTAGTIDVSMEIKNVLKFRGGAAFGPADVIISGDLYLTHVGIDISATIGVATLNDPATGASVTGVLVEAGFALPAGIPLACTAGVMAATGMTALFANDFGPRLEDDDSAATLTSTPNALDYVKWATGPLASDRVEDAWIPQFGAWGVGMGCIIVTTFDNGRVVTLKPVGGALISPSATELVFLAGGIGEIGQRPDFKVAAYLVLQLILGAGSAVVDASFGLGANVSWKAPKPQASAPNGVHFPPPAATPVRPGTTDSDDDDEGGDILDGEGKLDLLIPGGGLGTFHLDIGTPLEPVTVQFLRAFAQGGTSGFSAQAEVYIDISGSTGFAIGLGGSIGLELGSADGPVEIRLRAGLDLAGAIGGSPTTFAGDIHGYLEFRIRVFFIKLGIIADLRAAGVMSRPAIAIFDASLTIELPWPLPDLSLHTQLPVMSSPLLPELNPPLLAGSYQVGADD